MKYRNFLFVLLAVLLSVIALAGCESQTGTVQATDYSVSAHWLAVPSNIDKPVDVFYLYPTVWKKASPSDPNICEIDNPTMLKGAQLAYSVQATAFDTVGNVYAPYYRQVDAAYSLSLPLDQQDKILSGIPKADVFAALDYYFKNYNHDRSFILAGHSQGSNMLLYVLSEHMKEHPDVYSRMIAAYVIGYSVTADFLSQNPHLKFAQGPDDTGVIISYNTEAPNVTARNPVLLPGAIAINPIIWTREETQATAEQSLGSYMPDAQGNFALVKDFADARVDKARGVVICTVDPAKLPPGTQSFGPGIYHSFDYPFYYFNIRENAANRVSHYLAGK
jgi:hypothetical protein